jgi:hypothetical protein
MEVQNEEGPSTAMRGPSGNIQDDSLILSKVESARNGAIPTINVWLVPGETGIVTFPCPFCQYRGQPVWHRHGKPNAWLKIPGDELGHRWAHCSSESGRNAFRRGYMLRLAGTAPATKSPRTKAAPRRSPAALKRLDKVATFEQAARIVRAVAERDDRFFLVRVVLDESGYTDPEALCDSRAMTVRVPPHGVRVGSLIAELALLHVGGLGSSWIDYPKLAAEIEKLVLALAKEPQ